MSGEEWVYTVKEGDTLWSISEALLHNANDWGKIQALNAIKNPHKLTPNRQIRIPKPLLKKDKKLATVTHVHGEVVLHDKSGSEQLLKEQQQVFDGNKIETGENSNVRLLFKDGSSSLVQEKSQLEIDKLEFSDDKTNIQLKLQRGTINSDVRKKIRSRFEITTPSAIASVRGTSFRVANDPLTQQFRTEVLEGSVAVSSQGEELVVEKGFGTVVKAGEPPRVAKKLLTALDLVHLPILFTKQPVHFRFATLPGAVGYRVEVNKGESFQQQLISRDISSPVITIENLLNGQYMLRIFAYDSDGLGGKISTHQFEVAVAEENAQLHAPVLLQPEAKTKLRDGHFTFSWEESENASGYHFQLAQDRNFTQLIVDVYPYYFTQLSISDRLSSGNYFWHVAALSGLKNRKAFSDARSFRILPHIPYLEKAEYVDNEVLVLWSRGTASLSYRVQISEDRAFSKLVIDERASFNKFRFKTVRVADYFIRISSIDSDGYLSEPSNIRHIRLKQDVKLGMQIENVNSVMELSEF